VFSANCAGCHGASGGGGNGGPDISDPRALETIIAQVTNGAGGMPAFKGTLDEQQISDVAAYVFKEVEGQTP
jgi:cytochrome c6